eukprot:gb/GEZN01014397.1/.p1 GENE.gb/GEZN01014397.1/~~gb/GEZN01014397.1/.p1  ORF type:complete len:259 (+),score=26.48 gb/GEZN01014397.1/:31-777(+)
MTHMMSHDPYLKLREEHGPAGFVSHHMKIAGGLAGMALTAVAGFASGIFRSNTALGPTSTSFHAFFPKEGVDKVLVHPSLPTTLDFKPGFGGVSSLFLYTGTIPPALTKGAVSQEGWIYGAKETTRQGQHIGVPTGSPGDILRGRLLHFEESLFPQMLKTADQLWGGLRRQELKVVKADGTSEKAFWYFVSASASGASSSASGSAASSSASGSAADSASSSTAVGGAKGVEIQYLHTMVPPSRRCRPR